MKCLLINLFFFCLKENKDMMGLKPTKKYPYLGINRLEGYKHEEKHADSN